LPTRDTTRRDQVTVEAETVEDALVEISAELGEDAEIMRAQKVHRGGVGGFFAKEMVQLTARRRRGEPVPLRRKTSPGSGIAGVLERMAQDADAGDGDFRTALQRELASEPTEPDPEGFLTAVGWNNENEDPVEEPVSQDQVEPEILPDEQVVPSLAREVVDDDDPEPVAVGPVMQVAPPFPEVAVAPPTTELEPAAVVTVDEVVLPTSVVGPVVPIDLLSEPEFDEAASIELEKLETTNDAAERVVSDDDVAEPVVSDDEIFEIDAPPGLGSIDWSTTSLLRLGMPAPIISAVAHLEAGDDLNWIECIANAVEPHCGPLPQGDVIVVGPHAERLAEPLGLPLIHAGEMAPYDGSFCAMAEDSVQDRTWLEFVQGGRGIHLVIGDEPWQDLLVGEPVAVSWVGETAVADALYLAFTLGATLGFGTVDGFVSSMVRAQPTDVALAIRRNVGRR
jgi:hypothetical protein